MQVYFSDIASFTTISESMAPEDLVSFLGCVRLCTRLI